MLLGINTGSKSVSKYHIHTQEIILGDLNAIALEKAVTDADCTTSYGKLMPGQIGHFVDLRS